MKVLFTLNAKQDKYWKNNFYLKQVVFNRQVSNKQIKDVSLIIFDVAYQQWINKKWSNIEVKCLLKQYRKFNLMLMVKTYREMWSSDSMYGIIRWNRWWMWRRRVYVWLRHSENMHCSGTLLKARHWIRSLSWWKNATEKQ